MHNRFVLLLLLATVFIATPAVAVSRLFVDEITGYTNEDVRGAIFETKLLIVDAETVENGVIATGGPNAHFVNTPGKVHFNGNALNFSSNSSLDITSFGENIAFDGLDGFVNFGSNGEFNLESIGVSLNSYSDIGGTIGGVFGTNGIDAEVRSIGDFIINSQADFILSSEDRLTFTSNSFELSSLNAVVISSVESNIFSKAFQGNSLTAVGPLDIYAESGVEIQSTHGALNIFADYFGITSGNALFTAGNGINFGITGDVTLQATSTYGDIWGTSERIVLDRRNGNINVKTISQTDGVVALSTTGTIESFSNSITTLSNSLVFFSIDDISLKPAGNFIMTGSRSWSILASAGIDYISKDTTISAQTGNINFEIFGNSYVNTVFGNVVINSETEYNFGSGSTLFQGSTLLEIRADDLFIDASEYLHFKAASTISFTSPGIQFNSTDLFTIQSHEHTDINANNTYIGALQNLVVESSGDIRFIDSIDIIQETLGPLRYFVDRQIDVEASDAIITSKTTFINAQETISSESDATLTLESSSLQVSAFTDFTLKSGDTLTVTAPSVVVSTGVSGGIEFYTSKNGNINIKSTTFILDSAGNGAFSSSFDTTVTSTSNDVSGKDIIVSANDEIRFANVDPSSSLNMQADNIYSHLQTTLSITDDVIITGKEGVSISTGTLHQKEVSISTTTLTDDHQTVTIQGGPVKITVGDEFILGDTAAADIHLQDIVFTVGHEKDLSFRSGTDMNFIAQKEVLVSGGNIGTYASTYDATVARGFATFNADERFDVTSEDFLSITAPTASFVGWEQIRTFSGQDTNFDSGNTISTNSGLIELFGTNLINIDTFSYGLTASEGHYHHDVWTINSENEVLFDSQDISIYFNDVSLTQPSFVLASQHIEMNSINRISFETVINDITVTSNTVEVTTPQLTMIAENGFAFSGGTVILGSTTSTPLNRNLANVLFSVDGTLTQHADEKYSLIADGNDEFENAAIWFDAGVDITLQALTDYKATADNGIESLLGDTFSSYSDESHIFEVVDGSFIVEAQQPSQTGSNTITYTANGGSLTSIADKAQINFIAGVNIVSSALNDYVYNTAKQLTFSTTTEHASITDSITFESDGTQTWTAGQALHILAGAGAVGETRSDITGTIGTATNFQVGKDILFRTLGNEIPGATGGKQILFQGGSDGVEVDDDYSVVCFIGPISFFTSGEHTLVGTTASVWVSNFGDISYGSKSNEFDISSVAIMTFSAADTLYTEAHGVSGNVEYTVNGNGGISVDGNYTNSALGSIRHSNGGAFVEADNSILFDTNYHNGGITTHGGSIVFEALVEDIILSGKNFQSVNYGSVNIDSPIVNFGQDNVFTPQFTAFLNTFDLVSVGDISLSASDSNITLSSVETTTYSSDNNIVITSAGIIDFAATGLQDTTGISVNTAILTYTAADAIETVIEGTGTITVAPGTISLLSKGSKTANGFIVESENSVGVTAVGEFQQKITTTANINTGSADIEFTNSLTSTSTSLSMNSDNKLSFVAASALVETIVQSSRIEFITEGENSNIEFGSRGTFSLSSNDDLFFIADSFHQYVGGATTISATGQNSGKVQIDASDEISFVTSDDLDLTSEEDIYIQAEGVNSIISFITSEQIDHDANEVTYSTDADEGGSIFVNIESLDNTPSFEIDSIDWTIDIDGDLTLHAHDFNWESDDHAMAIYGYLKFESVGEFEMDASADIVVTAEQADVHFESGKDIQFETDDLLATGTSLDITVRGNATTNTNNFLRIDADSDLTLEATNGKLTWSAYDDIEVDSTISVKFQSDFVTPTTDGTPPIHGINVLSTYPGADINLQSEADAILYGNDVFISASSTEPESGYVKFIKDDNIISESFFQALAGEQIEIISEYGNTRWEYSTNLEIVGGDIHALAGRAIEFNVRGNGGSIINDPFALVQGKYAVSFEHLNTVQFQTETTGNILVESEAGVINIITQLFLARSDVDNLYLESTGNIAIYSNRDSMYAGVEFKSTGNIEFYTYDEEIYLTSEDLVIIAPGFDSLVQFYTEGNGKISYDIHGIQGPPGFPNSFFFAESELDINAVDGDIHIGATCDNCDDSLSLSSNSGVSLFGANIYYEYLDNLAFISNGVFISTNPTFPDLVPGGSISDPNNKGSITFAGKRNSVFNSGDDNTGPDTQVPRVIFPSVITFIRNDIQGPTIIQGGYCPVDRQVGFGLSSEFPASNEELPASQGVENGDFCICSDNVWACIPLPPFGEFFFSSYSYESYNSDVSSDFNIGGGLD